jgi:2-alkyl-3-oxoalkanoate reductase
MTILVAGAAGFVGRRLVEKLQARGEKVIAGVRTKRDRFERLGVEQRVFDAGDPVAVKAAMDGITEVINCVMGSAETMVAATRVLLAEARESRVRRFVHFSSIAVFGNAEGEIGDEHLQGQNVDAYGQAKIDCEGLVRAAQKAGLATVILRPGLIYGPGSEQWTARIGRLLQAGRLGDLGAEGDGTCNLVYLDDVADAAIAALSAPTAAGKAFNLALANAPSWNRYLLDFARALGAVPVNRIPSRQLKFETKLIAIPLKIAAILAARLRLGGRFLPDAITPGLGRLFSLEARYHSARADAVLGAQATSYAGGLKQSSDWLIGQKS